MKTIKDYFDIQELVCEDVYEKHGERAWAFFDPRLLAVLLFIRTNINKPIYVNNWDMGGAYSQRGYRCNLCSLVKEKNTLYCSAHMEGMAVDFDVKGMTAAEVRTWLYNNRERLPYPIRIESDVNWVHIDVRTDSPVKITYFATILAFMALILCGCSPKVITEYVDREKIEYVDRVQRDTTYVHDSIYVKQTGDTIFYDRYHTKYIEHTKIDSVYFYQTDTVRVDHTEYIKTEPTTWQKIKASFGLSLLWLIIGLFIYIAYKIWRR